MRITAAVFALLLPACLVGTGEIGGVDEGGEGGEEGGGGGGDGSGSGGGTTPTPKVAGTVDKTNVMTELGKTENLTITITGSDGFAGPVSITPTMADATGWTFTANPTSVDLAINGTATVQLEVKIPTNTAALAPTLDIAFGSTAAPAKVTSTFAVANQVTVNIGTGTGTGAPHAGLPSPNAPLRILRGAKVIFHNGDGIQHVIHADGGINHQNTGAGMPNTDYVTTPNDNATWYCHNHEGAGIARPILVQ